MKLTPERKLRLIVAVIFVLTTIAAIFLHAAWQCEIALITVIHSFLGKKNHLEKMAKILTAICRR
jgi:hypothetical protein